jgi:K+-transporting ATPase KdpF subunit
MSLESIIMLSIVVLTSGYLFYALLKPENF